MPADECCARVRLRADGGDGGKRMEASVGSGKAVGWVRSRGVRGKEGKEIPRVSASIRSSRAVITQSVSRTGACADGGMDAEDGRQ